VVIEPRVFERNVNLELELSQRRNPKTQVQKGEPGGTLRVSMASWMFQLMCSSRSVQTGPPARYLHGIGFFGG
jgi:hypothetical protein